MLQFILFRNESVADKSKEGKIPINAKHENCHKFILQDNLPTFTLNFFWFEGKETRDENRQINGLTNTAFTLGSSDPDIYEVG